MDMNIDINDKIKRFTLDVEAYEELYKDINIANVDKIYAMFIKLKKSKEEIKSFFDNIDTSTKELIDNYDEASANEDEYKNNMELIDKLIEEYGSKNKINLNMYIDIMKLLKKNANFIKKKEMTITYD